MRRGVMRAGAEASETSAFVNNTLNNQYLERRNRQNDTSYAVGDDENGRY